MRILASIGFTVLLASPVHAAVEYQFRQITLSDQAAVQAPAVTGRAILDGENTRVDYVSGSSFDAGIYLIARRDQGKLLVVNPKDKTYSVTDLSSVATSIGSRGIRIQNLKTKLTKMDGNPIVAGLPTDHYRLEATYEMTVQFGELALTQNIQTIVEKWTTGAFGDAGQSSLIEGPLRTGNDEIDQLIEAETSKVSGLPLRQVVTINTTPSNVRANSQLKTNGRRRHISEMIVTSIQARDVEQSYFEVPAGFTKVQQIKTGTSDHAVETLSMEPID